MSIDNALSLVGEIMDCYDKAELADACALRCALDCGKNLNLAKEAVGNGKWKKWREQNHRIGRIAALFMRALASAWRQFLAM